jgi:hypothetical protein
MPVMVGSGLERHQRDGRRRTKQAPLAPRTSLAGASLGSSARAARRVRFGTKRTPRLVRGEARALPTTPARLILMARLDDVQVCTAEGRSEVARHGERSAN